MFRPCRQIGYVSAENEPVGAGEDKLNQQTADTSRVTPYSRLARGLLTSGRIFPGDLGLDLE